MFGLFKSKYRIKTAACRVKIKRSAREARAFRDYLEFVEVNYLEGTQNFVFRGTWGAQKPHQINLAVPENLPETDQPKIIANLTDALQKLGYEFIILRFRPNGYSTASTQKRFEILARSQAAAPDSLRDF